MKASNKYKLNSLRKLTETLKNKIGSEGTIEFKEDYGHIIIKTPKKNICIYPTHTGLFRIYENNLKLQFKSINSITDFILHTYTRRYE